MTRYEIIVEELQNRVNSGKITLEFAESVNDLAYSRYVEESAKDFLHDAKSVLIDEGLVIPIIIGASFVGIIGGIGGAIGGLIRQDKKQRQKIEKAIELYETNNKKLVPFSQLEEKIYKISKFDSEVKNITGNKKEMSNSSKKLYQYYKNGKVYIQFFTNTSYQGDATIHDYITKISNTISNKNDKLYYLTCVTYKNRGTHEDCISWADDILKKYNDK